MFIFTTISVKKVEFSTQNFLLTNDQSNEIALSKSHFAIIIFYCGTQYMKTVLPPPPPQDMKPVLQPPPP
jgi:hypothetical protein